jgi:hypothetical protein
VTRDRSGSASAVAKSTVRRPRSLYFSDYSKEYECVDFTDLHFASDHILSQALMFLDGIFLFLELLTEQMYSVSHEVKILLDMFKLAKVSYVLLFLRLLSAHPPIFIS